MIDPRPFQRRFLARALAPGIDTAALSIPRGNGKTWLAGHVLTRCLTPGGRAVRRGGRVPAVRGVHRTGRGSATSSSGPFSSLGAGIGSWTVRRGSVSRTDRPTRGCGCCRPRARRRWASSAARCSWQTSRVRGKGRARDPADRGPRVQHPTGATLVQVDADAGSPTGTRRSSPSSACRCGATSTPWRRTIRWSSSGAVTSTC